MFKKRVYVGGLIALLSLGIYGPNSTIEEASASTPKNTIVLKTPGATISFPASVKITPRRCGEFKVNYSTNGSRPVWADIKLTDMQGEWIGFQRINRASEFRREWDAPKGTKYFEYCKSDWEDDFGDQYPGVEPGWIYVELTERTSANSSSTKKERFIVRK